MARKRDDDPITDGGEARDARPAPPFRFTPAQLAARWDGWTPDKQVGFIEALAESACVDEACRAVGMSRQSAYALRRRPDAQSFRLAWEAALDYAVRRLGDALISRALNGVAVPHYYKGEQVGEHRRFDNRLGMWIMRQRDPTRYGDARQRVLVDRHPDGEALLLALQLAHMAGEARGEDRGPDPLLRARPALDDEEGPRVAAALREILGG